MANGWKITAIIFIILFILQTILFVGIIYLGYKEISKESECSVNICKDYDAYIYDSTYQICYCYKDGEVAHTKYLS